MENSISIIDQCDQELLNMNDDRIKPNQQTLKTFDWLKQTFQFRSGVSIARSLIYESYQKFCQQNNFLPICKATFGKLIRNHFPMVKSKRLGARGQSKYHVSMNLNVFLNQSNQSQNKYYNINFRENDRINNLHTNGRNNNNNNCEITFNEAKSSETSSTLTILSKNKSKIIDYNHENDYNSIIQSMISFIRLPEDQLYNNDELIFTNLYKTHCQFLLDAALNKNYGQMRHYIMHFWQQLPSNIVIFIDQMKLLDSFMYSSLCRLYLSLDSDDKNLQHINTIGHVMYVWIKEIFNNSNNMNKWKLISNQYDLSYLNTIKLNDALKWKFKIKFIVNLIALLKKIDFTIICESVNHLAMKMNSIQTNHHHHYYYLFDDGNYISQIIINEFWQLVQQLQIDYHQNNRSSSLSSSSLLIDRFDQMIKSIVDCFFSINHHNQSKTKLQLNKFYQNLSMEFNHIINQINRFEIIDDDEDYQEDQESISTSDDDDDDWFDYEDDHYLAKLDAQSYLISMIINNYLLLVCQSSSINDDFIYFKK